MKCALCGKDFDGTNKGFAEHAKLDHYKDDDDAFIHHIVTLTKYIFALQKRIEELENIGRRYANRQKLDENKEPPTTENE